VQDFFYPFTKPASAKIKRKISDLLATDIAVLQHG
jgi:hypothetical protein